ncbi:MAG: gliding motility lipoprotein GldD [Bacteroidales bacterium]|nr:gliding motility lipoprotein GldD [Bacteroidales bacterium]
MTVKKINNLLILSIISILLVQCSETYTPKPRGYFRVTFPEKKYKKFESKAPYTFEIPVYSEMVPDTNDLEGKWWYNLQFPAMKATLHISYKDISGNLEKYLEDSRTLVYKHTIKADAINEQTFMHPAKKVYGILYEIKGNAASPYQFFVTDSTKHFVRGALYFNVYPNKDSLAPSFKFLKQDLIHLMETLEWK